MAVDLAAIRKRVQELSGQRRNSNVQLWKPGPGEHKVRGLPWPSTPDGMPFIERRFYYIGTNSGILAPSQFGKPDPINDLIRKLYSTNSPDDRALAKQLQPKMRAYMPVIVRGQEDKGVQVWSFGKMVYQRLLGFFTEEDVGDILDPLEGFDLKVTISQAPGKQFMDTVVDAGRRSSKLADDAELAKKWLDGVPNIDDMYRQKTVQEIEQVLNAWLAGGASESGDEGSTRGADRQKDELDRLVDEVKTEVKSEVRTAPVTAKADDVAPPKSTKKGKAAAAPDLDDDKPAAKQTLDDAFNELMEKDDE